MVDFNAKSEDMIAGLDGAMRNTGNRPFFENRNLCSYIDVTFSGERVSRNISSW